MALAGLRLLFLLLLIPKLFRLLYRETQGTTVEGSKVQSGRNVLFCFVLTFRETVPCLRTALIEDEEAADD